MQVLKLNGAFADLDSMACAFAYDGSGNLTTKTWTDGTWSWVQTFTYSGTTLTGSSAITRSV